MGNSTRGDTRCRPDSSKKSKKSAGADLHPRASAVLPPLPSGSGAPHRPIQRGLHTCRGGSSTGIGNGTVLRPSQHRGGACRIWGASGVRPAPRHGAAATRFCESIYSLSTLLVVPPRALVPSARSPAHHPHRVVHHHPRGVVGIEPLFASRAAVCKSVPGGVWSAS